MKRTKFYNDFLKLEGLFDSADRCRFKHDMLTTNITVTRGQRPGALTTEERLALERVIQGHGHRSPHACSAQERYRRSIG